MRRVFAAAAGGLLLSWAGLATVAFAAPVEAYGEYEAIGDVHISPKGDKLVLATATSDTSRAVVILSVGDGHVLGGINFKDQKLRALQWADDDHVLITLSQTAKPIDLEGPRREWFMTESYEVATGKQTPLLENVDKSMNVAGDVEPRIVDGHTVLYVEGIYFPSMRGILALYAIDLTEGRTRLIESSSPNANGWVIDRAGNVVAEEDYNQRRRRRL